MIGTSGRNETEVSGTAGSGDQVATDSNVRRESTIAQNDTPSNPGAVSELPGDGEPAHAERPARLLSLAGAAGIRSFRL